MHYKLQVSITLHTHVVTRDMWVPEFYTLPELSHVIQASIGWDEDTVFTYRSGDLQWIYFTLLEEDDLDNGQYLAEGTTLGEVVNYWKDDGAVYECGGFRQWEFKIRIKDSMEAHPDNLLVSLCDGKGDMPEADSDAFAPETLQLLSNEGPIAIKTRRLQRMRLGLNSDKTFGKCTEAVALKSIEISRARRESQRVQ